MAFPLRDVSRKYSTLRTARAAAALNVQPSTIAAIRSGNLPKADPLGVARVAGINAAKQTSLLIPYCHQVPLDFVSVEITLEENSILAVATVKAIWKTGVEMEALVAASTAALTLYDMLKIIDEKMDIASVRLLEKKGGKSAMTETGEGRTAAVIVLSDSVSKGTANDESGKLLAEQLKKFRMNVLDILILPDDGARIERELKSLADERKVDLIITTGGTGVGPRDVTPEATENVVDKRLTGVEEALRKYGQDRLPTAMLSRGMVGVRGTTLIINLPGSRRAAEDGIDALFPAILHTFRMLQGDRHKAT